VAGNSTTESFFDVFVDLTAPVAVHDGPFVVNEGSTIQLDGRASWDALSRLKSTAWSIHGDGVFDDGDPAFFSALDGPSTHVVLLRVEDVAGNEATVTTEVIVMNVPPVAVDDAYGVDEDNLLIIAAPGVLGNDSDVGADSLTAILVAGPANGTLVLNSDGSFTYTPDANFNGTDSFTYRAFDGDDYSNEATVTIAVRSVIDAVIDIKPGSEPNSINLGSKGVLPVAILSTQRAKGELEDLDARLVDVATILFGDARSGYGRVAPIRSAVEDVDGDGDLDLILHFDMEQIVGNRALDADSVDAVLSAEIFGGPAGGFDLIGFDHLSIVPSGNGKKKG
jgi:hypothetical protein